MFLQEDSTWLHEYLSLASYRLICAPPWLLCSLSPWVYIKCPHVSHDEQQTSALTKMFPVGFGLNVSNWNGDYIDSIIFKNDELRLL